MTIIHLSETTIFPDLNQIEKKEPEYARSELQLTSLKYKHFRSIMKYPEQDQMHHLMMAMTSLSEDDIGELSPNDAAKVSTAVFDSMQSYMELGKKIVRGLEDKK
jgi:hypothetical protein